MHPLAVVKTNNPFGLGSHAARVLGGLYGQVEPSPNDPSKSVFFIDPALKHAFPSVDMVGGGNGIEINSHEVMELALPSANHVSALKSMLCKGLSHRWKTLYEQQLNSMNREDNSLLYSMLDAERFKALNALKAVTDETQGMVADTVNVVSTRAGFNGERFLSDDLRPAPSVSENESNGSGLSEAQLVEELNDDARGYVYDVYATVPVMMPAPVAPLINANALTHESSERELIESSGTSSDDFKALLMSDSIFPLWADSVKAIALDQVDLQRSKSLCIIDMNDDDYDENYDEDYEVNEGLSRPSN